MLARAYPFPKRVRRGLVHAMAFGWVVASLGACTSAEDVRQDEVRARLAGTWQREDAGEGVRVLRQMHLRPDGEFTERVERSATDASPQRTDYAGEWSYDGTHLKRRFLAENGRAYAGGQMRFATFPLVEVGARDLVLQDTISKQRVSYRRQ